MVVLNVVSLTFATSMLVEHQVCACITPLYGTKLLLNILWENLDMYIERSDFLTENDLIEFKIET